jgi:hypothetical protein
VICHDPTRNKREKNFSEVGNQQVGHSAVHPKGGRRFSITYQFIGLQHLMMSVPTKRIFEDEENQKFWRQISKGESSLDLSNATAPTCTDASFDSDDSFNGKTNDSNRKIRKISSFSHLPSTIDTGSLSNDEKPEVILFGVDLTHLPANRQYEVCAFGVFFFNMLYGFLQELIQIRIAGREFALFLAAWQFFGYFVWSSVLAKLHDLRVAKKAKDRGSIQQFKQEQESSSKSGPRIYVYLGLATLRALDLGLTNLSMKYLNYPAKTLIKSSRVLFTMVLGTAIGKKEYQRSDITMVVLLVIGLCLFLHADMTTSAVFHPIGVLMLVRFRQSWSMHTCRYISKFLCIVYILRPYH